ncbi:MAG: ABC transporter permease subunit, partial [bacterium]
RLHSGVIIAALLAGTSWLVIFRLPFGFRLRAIGQNPKAARFAGINVSRHIVAAIALSGGLAALGGAIEVAGVTHRLYENISPGYGYTVLPWRCSAACTLSAFCRRRFSLAHSNPAPVRCSKTWASLRFLRKSFRAWLFCSWCCTRRAGSAQRMKVSFQKYLR